MSSVLNQSSLATLAAELRQSTCPEAGLGIYGLKPFWYVSRLRGHIVQRAVSNAVRLFEHGTICPRRRSYDKEVAGDTRLHPYPRALSTEWI